MKRIETTIAKIKDDIRTFYQPALQHFIVMNAVDFGEELEVQWFFSDYAPPYDITAFCARVRPQEEIPSMKDVIASAWVAEAELADLLGVNIENTERGFVLEPDSEAAPLRKKK